MPSIPEERIAVLIPAFRAEATVGSVVAAIHAAHELHVLVVDDGSGDATSEVARAAGAEVVVHPVNGGKGTALGTGLRHLTREGFHWAITVDADGQHLPSEIGRFLSHRRGERLGLVVGARDLHVRSMPWPRVCSNRLTTALLELQAGCRLWDSQCGFRMYRLDAVWDAGLPEQGRFEWESSALVRMARKGWGVERVPVSTVYEDAGSHIHPWRDTARFIRLWFSLWKVVFARRRPE